MTRKITMLLAAVLCLASCQDQQGQYEPQRAQGAVKFHLGMDGVESKAVYSGEVVGNVERIDWQSGDAVGIYCASAKNGTYAKYVVKSNGTAVGGVSKGEALPDGPELVWGEDVAHVFYSYFPEKSEEGGIAKGMTETKVSAELPASQAVKGAITNNVAAPDLKNMLMTAKSPVYTPVGGACEAVVSLDFVPLTTAVQFTITNQTKAAMTVSSVSLTSASGALNGPFTVDISDTSHQPESIALGNKTITYSHTYPYCEYKGTVTEATRTVSIEFNSPVTLAYDADPSKSGSLTFTFFLQPCQNFDDLTFRITKSDSSWMQTRLGYTDGSGLVFPRYMKSKVDGIFVPEGAQWTVKYGPTVDPWNPNPSEVDPMPEIVTDPVVTSWETGIDEELALVKSILYLPGVFSVGPFEYVQFSRGNLYAKKNGGSNWSWNMYDQQYKCNSLNGADAGRTATSNDDEIDLFCWGYDDPGSFDPIENAIHINGSVDLPYEKDWGSQIEDGKTWRTLSMDEIKYLLGTSEERSGKYKCGVTVCGVPKCLVIAPDECLNGYIFDNTKSTYSADEWIIAHNAGLVCLPAAGKRSGATVSELKVTGNYWSSSKSTQYSSPLIFSDALTLTSSSSRNNAYSVRLVKDVETELEFVDLGLPSGTLWANKNMGAANPSDPGFYYSWGETTPEGYPMGDYGSWTGGKNPNYVQGNIKETVTWTYYKWSSGAAKDDLKYTSANTATELDKEDDPAYVTFGEGYGLPTKAQVEELLSTEYTTCTAVKVGTTLKGYMVKGKNGNSIFLPVTGEWTGGTPHQNPNNGYFLTCSRDSKDQTNFYSFYFTPTVSPKLNEQQRVYAPTARPVKLAATH